MHFIYGNHSKSFLGNEKYHTSGEWDIFPNILSNNLFCITITVCCTTSLGKNYIFFGCGVSWKFQNGGIMGGKKCNFPLFL